VGLAKRYGARAPECGRVCWPATRRVFVIGGGGRFLFFHHCSVEWGTRPAGVIGL